MRLFRDLSSCFSSSSILLLLHARGVGGKVAAIAERRWKELKVARSVAFAVGRKYRKEA